jgi:hypothetical protein
MVHVTDNIFIFPDIGQLLCARADNKLIGTHVRYAVNWYVHIRAMCYYYYFEGDDISLRSITWVIFDVFFECGILLR